MNPLRIAGLAIFPCLYSWSAGFCLAAPVTSADSLMMRFEAEDLAIVRHLNGGNFKSADMISNTLLLRLEEAISDPGLAAYKERLTGLKERVARFDDEVLDPLTGDFKDEKLWPVTISADWVMNFLERWRSSWEAGDIDSYIKLYSARFRSSPSGGGLGIREWEWKKRRLAAVRKDIRISITSPRIERRKGRIVVRFLQTYRSGQFSSVGEKVMVIRRERGGWRIYREYIARLKSKRYGRISEAAATRSPPTLGQKPAVKPVVYGDEEERVRELIESWVRAWRSMSLERYLSFYSSRNFRTAGLDLKAWGNRKRDIWARSGFIKLGIDDLSVELEGDTATVRFIQDYHSRSLHDRGRKTLMLVREGGTWKIVRESWSPLVSN